VNNACKLMPRRYKAQCDALMRTYGVHVIDFMQATTDPFKVCHSIRVCSAEDAPQLRASGEHRPIGVKILQEEKEKSSVVAMTEIKPAKHVKLPAVSYKNNSLECSLCVYAAQVIDNALKENKTETEILVELKLICNLFPGNYRDQCTAFMEEYGPYVMQLIADDIDPEEACVSLKMCEKQVAKKSWRFNLWHSRND